MNNKCIKILSMILSLIILVGVIYIPAMADDEIKVTLNGAQLTFDVPPQTINDRTMVPMRKIFEALGAKVDWDENRQVAVATNGKIELQIKVDSTLMAKNKKPLYLNVPPQMVNDRILVPVRAVAEGFDADVNWDEATKTVIITTSDNLAPTATPAPAVAPTADAVKTKEVFFTSIKLPNDDTAYPLFMRDVALVGEDGTCYAAQTTLYRILTMAKYGYRILDMEDSTYFPGFDKVCDIPMGITGFTAGPGKSGSIYDENNMAKKYQYSSEGKDGCAPAIYYHSRCYLKITDVLDFFEIPYESVTYDAEKDNIIVALGQSEDLHQVEESE